MPRWKKTAKSEEQLLVEVHTPRIPHGAGRIPAARDTVTVTLIGPVVHAGVRCIAGDKIEVKARQVEWLREQGVI